MPTSHKITEVLINSAVLMGIVGAFSFSLGYNLDVSDATTLGVPREFLPQRDFHSRLYTGGIFLLLLVLVSLFAVALSSFCFRHFKQEWQRSFSKYAQDRLQKHPYFYGILFVLIAAGASITAARLAPNARPIRNMATWQRVVKIETTADLSSTLDTTDLRIFTIQPDSVVFFDNVARKFVMLRRDAITLLSFESTSSDWASGVANN